MKTKLFEFNLEILFIFIIAKYLNISAKDCCDCCDNCLKPKKIIKTTNENTGEQNDDFIEPYYDLSQINTLEEINLNQDLERIFIQLLSEKLYNVFDCCSLNGFNVKLWEIRKDEKLNQIVLSYEKSTREQLKNFFNEKYIITKDKFETISDDFIKILATFFLKKEDYDKYLKECVDEKKDKNIQNDSNKEDISNLLNEDESFMDALNTYINNNSDLFNDFKDAKQNLKLLSEKLQLCSPYKGTTYRGTKIYNKEQKALELKENNKEENYKIIKTFLEKIKSTTWSDRPSNDWLTSFSSDPLVAGYFALKHPEHKFFPRSPLFRIVIRNYINKTGVYLYENWDPNNTKFTKGIPKEREVLYPQGSKFKILGMRLEILQTYPCPSGIPNLYEVRYKKIIKGKETWSKFVDDNEDEDNSESKKFQIDEKERTAQSFACPFIVLDVVEE